MTFAEQPDLLTTYEGHRTTAFLGWNRPLCELAADYLSAGWTSGTLDLTGLLVLVPTRQSGRKLRETLAAKVSTSGGAVTPPIVTTPDALASPGLFSPEELDIADPAEVLKAWIDVLTSIDLETVSSLFPVDPPDREFNWALHTAADLIQLRKDLGENGLLISDAAKKLKAAGIEPDRWIDLSRIERKAIARLKDSGLRDPQSARRIAAESPKPIPGITRVILLGTPDPSPLAVRILESYSKTIPVEVVIYAPESLADTFDAWGRPEKIQWNSRNVEIPDPDRSITVSPNPKTQAATTTARISQYTENGAAKATPAGVVAVGIGDPEVVPHLHQTLHGIGIDAFDPAGTPASDHAVTSLLRHLRDLLESDSIPAFVNLLRSADILDALADEAAEKSVKPTAPDSAAPDKNSTFNPIALLRKLDDFVNHHLPDSLTDLSTTISVNPGGTADIRFALGTIRHWLDRLTSENLGSVLPDFLGWAFSARQFRADRPEDSSTAEVARLVSAALDSMDGKIFSTRIRLKAKERLDLLLHLVSSTRITTDRRPHDIELQGWLELLWEDAPHLILTGFNEGKIPESIIGDAYLPDSARDTLGLRDNEDRLARDAYLLTALVQSRQRARGRVDFLVGATSQSSDPLRPSRLLFKCDRRELPERALRLFGTPDSEKENIGPRTFPWKLDPPSPRSPETQISKLSVTRFADFLTCPFRFYLRHNLRMSEIEVGKMEMNYADFGNVIHEVLYRFGSDATLRDSDDPKLIREFLLDHAAQIAERRFGRNLPVPVLIQCESINQRLGWVAEKQAEIRRAGWRIDQVEWRFGTEEKPFIFDGFPVTGQIDRIDRHENSSALRILDYKTGKALTPEKDHLGTVGSARLHDWELAQDERGNPRRWRKLQLPLYQLAARQILGADPRSELTTGYFHIPKSRSDCGISLWENLDPESLRSAESCARGVIAQIRSRAYWPPREVNPRYDDFSSLLFGSPEKAVTPPADSPRLESEY